MNTRSLRSVAVDHGRSPLPGSRSRVSLGSSTQASTVLDDDPPLYSVEQMREVFHDLLGDLLRPRTAGISNAFVQSFWIAGRAWSPRRPQVRTAIPEQLRLSKASLQDRDRCNLYVLFCELRFSAFWSYRMNDPTITADESPAVAETRELQIELPAGEDEVSYPRGVKIKDVKLKGMRNKPVPLTRRPWEEIVQMNQFTRGVPDRYALERPTCGAGERLVNEVAASGEFVGAVDRFLKVHSVLPLNARERR